MASSSSAISFLFIALIVGFASSARILVDEVSPDPSVLVSPPGVSVPDGTVPDGTVPDGAANVPAVGDNSADLPVVPDTAVPPPADVAAPVVAPPADGAADPPQVPDTPDSITPPATNVVPDPEAAAATSAATLPTPGVAGEPQLSFYMHDIIGGTHPSARVVTGIITSTDVNAVPFSKPTNVLYPFNGGIPITQGSNFNGAELNGIINNNNLPYLIGFNGAQATTVIQNNGNANQVTGGNNQPFVSAGQLPAGATLQKLMFGTITVIDDELTEGQELGSVVIGKAQGFYLASSLDGTSQTLALTLLFSGNNGSSIHEVDDTISLFGVHRTAFHQSQVAIVGGTGKYGHAKGYAVVETLPQKDQHTTDGVDTILHFSFYFSE